MKRITFPMLALISSASIFAQRNLIDIGLEGGPSLTSMRGNEIIEIYSRPALRYAAALFVQYNFPKVLSIRSNLAFESKGSVVKATMVDENGTKIGNYTGSFILNYFTVPLLLRATFGKKARIFINAGPFIGHLVKNSFVNQQTDRPTVVTQNAVDYKRWDAGLTSGLGLEIPIQNRFAIACELRNNLGLYNLSKYPVYNGGSVKTNATSILVSFAYKLGARPA